ncbi:MAG: preprotein translocase subunit SecG, preprotein translocase subunit SecG [candidate division WS6 bacterium GW2011_GWC1_33_20]|uniref:Protein-export membrane protein SecG n=2 Tax=Candidatus Dojkabacteria TaxID=74243 RepID=A0A0G0DIN6_9BACT|nr:MAG: preprotein translocase subunit SecG, preprotein translocase subunit SecG [candidate division WS6 bacterium GW2011_GWC1_33_20]KKP55227.1 MAG: Preprotein translocase, SecG subunit [candidate division WS6 bacterium GW2011_GWB1_33_6]KKP82190.1 MAG: Preprotein translocase, SecG subunit [candidate division WS6 bacterium GW2011_GWD1_35_594]OGC37224.1 MAG: preprotein translocase subunit SecG [candidate division WS6 bacterium RIFOXYC1_FULL_33_9]
MSPNLQNTILYTQIVVCVLVVISVLLQNRAEGLGKMFGGGGEVFRTKRGLEKFLYYSTIFLTILLVTLSLLLYKYSS